MRAGSSTFYEKGIVILEQRDFPMSAEIVMAAARGDYEAVMLVEGDGSEMFVVRTPEDVHEGLYLEDDLRRKMRRLNDHYARK